MWSCLGDSCAFCHRASVAVRGEGAICGNPRGSVGGNIAVQREDRREGGEEYRGVGGYVEEEKKRNGSTNAGTCISNKGCDKKAETMRTSSSSSSSKERVDSTRARSSNFYIASKSWGLHAHSSF